MNRASRTQEANTFLSSAGAEMATTQGRGEWVRRGESQDASTGVAGAAGVDVGKASTVSHADSIIGISREAAATFPTYPDIMASLSVVTASTATPSPPTQPS